MSNAYSRIAIDTGDKRFCEYLFGIPMYTQARSLSDVYGLAVRASAGTTRVIDVVGNGVRWQSRDDLFSSVRGWVWSKYNELLPEMRGLPKDTSAGEVGDFDISALYNRFNRKDFESNVLPYLRKHNHTAATKYDTAAADIDGLAPPDVGPLRDLALWGRFFNIIRKIYVDFRKETRPPPVPCLNFPTNGDALTFAEAMKDWPEGAHVVPMSGERFEEFEIKALQVAHPDVHVIGDETGPQTCFKNAFYDVFKAIGSTFLILPPLPVPTAGARETVVTPGTPERCVSALSKTEGERTAAVGDGLDAMRNYVLEHGEGKSDLNTGDGIAFVKAGIPHTQRDCRLGFEWEKPFSKTRRGTLLKRIPRGRISFAQCVECYKAENKTPAANEGCAWWLACKLVVAWKNFPLEFEGGELYINRPEI